MQRIQVHDYVKTFEIYIQLHDACNYNGSNSSIKFLKQI